MKHVVWISILLLVAVGGFFGWRYFHTSESVIPGAPDFVQEGVLRGGLPGNTNGWSIQYEKPGVPAFTTALTFTNDTLCIREDVGGRCDFGDFKIGERVSIVGNTTDTGVTVTALTFLEPYKVEQ